tara:strand:- start:603 stop:1583 length:981 start_codon:yes stop_codon:yes gene_type:complete
MDLIDSKYISLLSARLDKFKKVKNDLYNFRCPICGDSQKHKNKARGYFYSIKNNTNYKCHNCGASLSFANFLKQLDPTLYKKFVMEKFKGGFAGRKGASAIAAPKEVTEFESPTFNTPINLPFCKDNVHGRTYLESRKIDSNKFYYADKFCEFTNSLKQTFGSNVREEPRIVIPLFYKKKLVGFQGRSLGPSSVKYITIMLYDDAPKIYGLDQIKEQTPVYITEGPFDSSFVTNSIAMCGADGDVRQWGVSDPIWVYDNEPRNREICTRIKDTIDRGEKVVIWPSNLEEKDINDMVLAGHNIMPLLESNTYQNLEAKVKFNTWKKV